MPGTSSLRACLARSLRPVLLLLASLTLTACFDDSSPGSRGTVNGPSNAGRNSAPVISGVAPTNAHVGAFYVFIPQANDADGDPLTYSVSGLPNWLRFDATTGQLSGVPGEAAIGAHKDIRIAVSDGVSTTALPAFSILVAKSASAGSAKLSWVAPTQTSSGRPLAGLAGFRVYYGLKQPNFDRTLEVRDPAASTVTITGLGRGTWYFTVTAFTKSGAESSRSKVVMKTI